ncbi:hypothetical protein AB5J72_50775 [Streptomyces sp. CG1]
MARELRVTSRSVRRWRCAWQLGGGQALRSKGRCPSSGSVHGSGSGWSGS